MSINVAEYAGVLQILKFLRKCIHEGGLVGAPAYPITLRVRSAGWRWWAGSSTSLA